MSTLYLDDDMMEYKDIFLQAIQDIEGLGYSFKPTLLINAYRGRSKKLYIYIYDYGTHRIMSNQLAINTIYHELAHATVECHFKGHRKEFKKLRNQILEAYKIDIGGAISDYY